MVMRPERKALWLVCPHPVLQRRGIRQALIAASPRPRGAPTPCSPRWHPMRDFELDGSLAAARDPRSLAHEEKVTG